MCPAKELRFQENEELRLKDAYDPHWLWMMILCFHKHYSKISGMTICFFQKSFCILYQADQIMPDQWMRTDANPLLPALRSKKKGPPQKQHGRPNYFRNPGAEFLHSFRHSISGCASPSWSYRIFPGRRMSKKRCAASRWHTLKEHYIQIHTVSFIKVAHFEIWDSLAEGTPAKWLPRRTPISGPVCTVMVSSYLI